MSFNTLYRYWNDSDQLIKLPDPLLYLSIDSTLLDATIFVSYHTYQSIPFDLPVVILQFVHAQRGQRIDLSDIQGKWAVEEYFPKSVSSNGSSLACDSNLDVSYEISGNIWRRMSSNPDR
jgi:hypothetical protein